MKTLANCDPVEFFVQTNRIRKAAENWITLTQIREIRKRVPEFKGDDAENTELLEKQVRENADAILESVMGEHPKETAELLGLMCFIEPEDLHNHESGELLIGFREIVNSRAVIGFFASLWQLGRMFFSTAATR